MTIMNTRLKQFLAAENITQAQFADTIDVVRASVSHVLAGRNNPSYDFLKALMSKYPRLNMEWLMFGKGKMYKDTEEQEFIVNLQESPLNINDGVLFTDDQPVRDSVISEQVADSPATTPATTEIKTADNPPQHLVTQRKVSKIIVLFDDGSFQEIKEMPDTIK